VVQGKISLDEFRVMAAQNLVPSLADTFMHDNGRDFEANDENVYADARRRRDEKLQANDPKAWCADRCLATGCERNGATERGPRLRQALAAQETHTHIPRVAPPPRVCAQTAM